MRRDVSSGSFVEGDVGAMSEFVSLFGAPLGEVTFDSSYPDSFVLEVDPESVIALYRDEYLAGRIDAAELERRIAQALSVQ